MFSFIMCQFFHLILKIQSILGESHFITVLMTITINDFLYLQLILISGISVGKHFINRLQYLQPL